MTSGGNNLKQAYLVITVPPCPDIIWGERSSSKKYLGERRSPSITARLKMSSLSWQQATATKALAEIKRTGPLAYIMLMQSRATVIIIRLG